MKETGYAPQDPWCWRVRPRSLEKRGRTPPTARGRPANPRHPRGSAVPGHARRGLAHRASRLQPLGFEYRRWPGVGGLGYGWAEASMARRGRRHADHACKDGGIEASRVQPAGDGIVARRVTPPGRRRTDTDREGRLDRQWRETAQQLAEGSMTTVKWSD